MTKGEVFGTTRRHFLSGTAAFGALTLAGCNATPSARFDAEVIILGAGLAGLHAARLLSGEGKDVLVLEASSRIGGRIKTLDHGALGRTEAGGEQVGASYARILDTAAQLGVALTLDSSMPRGTCYSYNGRLYDGEAWKTSADTPFKRPFRGAAPNGPLFRLAAKNNPLLAASDWREAAFAKFDINAYDFLKANDISAEGRRVIEIALNGNDLSSYSMLNLYRSLQLYTQSRGMGVSASVDGGAQRLPEAMAASLPRAVAMQAQVSAVTMDDMGVTVDTDSGKSYRAAHCICALPFPAARTIRGMTGLLPPLQRQAMAGLPYTQIFQIHLHIKGKFWERDGLPADMWTDSSLERVFADRDAEGEPTGLFRVWINGEPAQKHGSIRAHVSNTKEGIERQLRKIRPSIEGGINVLGTANWTQANPLAGGAYMHWVPGQVAKWAGKMGTPIRRLSFAGEHLSYLHTGMEGAMESGENAALALLGT